jgi:hypothetical protein
LLVDTILEANARQVAEQAQDRHADGLAAVAVLVLQHQLIAADRRVANDVAQAIALVGCQRLAANAGADSRGVVDKRRRRPD